MFKYYISEVEGGGGSRPSLISLMQGGVGGSESWKIRWCNTWTLPNQYKQYKQAEAELGQAQHSLG